MPATRACDLCLARSWLIARLAAHLETARSRISEALALADDELIDALAGASAPAIHQELSRFDPRSARLSAAGADLELVCRCDPSYPRRLNELPNRPAVLHVAGGLERFLALASQDPVAIVGARRASPYGIDVARALGRDLGASGITVISGMALGIDSAAHAGALAAGAPTVAVLPGGADRPYPASKRALRRQIAAAGAVVAELPAGSAPWRWTFPARNRIIAGLAAVTVVVEAGERSGALITASLAGDLARPVGAVPGRITSPLASGPNALIKDGAPLVRNAQDVLDLLYGPGTRTAVVRDRPELSDELRQLLARVAAGSDTANALAGDGVGVDQALAALAALELAGYIRREPGGRFALVP